MLTESEIQKIRKNTPSYKRIFPPRTEGLFSDELVGLVGEANREIGNLNSYARIIPNADLLIWPLLLKESLASSKIEGTHASVKDVLKKEANIRTVSSAVDVQEVVNYREATKLGWKMIETMPISGRMLKDIHRRLMQGEVRGKEKRIGEYRVGQNAIGKDKEHLKFIPPPPQEVPELMGDLEKYINDKKLAYDKLVRSALMHYEFEAVHPFADGNGRVGRVLMILYLLKENALKYPLIYPSSYFLRHKVEYETRLLNITTKGDWRGWLIFFMKAIIEQSLASARLIENIDALYQGSLETARLRTQSNHAAKLIEIVFQKPIIEAPIAARMLGVEHATAMSLLRRFVHVGILTVDKGKKKNIPFYNSRLINLLERIE